MNRRQFAQTAAGAVAVAPFLRASKLAPVADGIRVGHRISPTFTDDDLAFFKNMGIAGGLFAIAAWGPGAWSLDARTGTA